MLSFNFIFCGMEIIAVLLLVGFYGESCELIQVECRAHVLRHMTINRISCSCICVCYEIARQNVYAAFVSLEIDSMPIPGSTSSSTQSSDNRMNAEFAFSISHKNEPTKYKLGVNLYILKSFSGFPKWQR